MLSYSSRFVTLGKYEKIHYEKAGTGDHIVLLFPGALGKLLSHNCSKCFYEQSMIFTSLRTSDLEIRRAPFDKTKLPCPETFIHL